MRPQRNHSWNSVSQDELKVGRHTVRLKRSLGEGGFAFIHLVEDVNTGRVLVLKRSTLQSHEGRVVYEKEASVMRSLAHPNIVQIVTAVELPGSKTGAILMEFCPRGHLLEALNGLGGKRMPEAAVLSVMCDVVSAAKYMHDKGITHRDIKLENILRSSSGPHKLCDFGSCVQGRVPLETAEQRGNEEEIIEKTTTQMYRAPEMVDLYLERELTEKVDVWALGCVLYAVCYLKNPFQDAGNLGILNARIRIPDDSEFSSGLVDLIQRCLTASSTQRPSASEVENGLHALGKGDPLPPPRHRKPSEVERAPPGVVVDAKTTDVARTPPAAHAVAPTSTPSGPPNTGGAVGRDVGKGGGGGGRGMDGSGRSRGGAVSAAGRSSSQSTKASNAAPVSQPQLNPNSVAARRLASRKGSGSTPPAAGATGGARNLGASMPSSLGQGQASAVAVAAVHTEDGGSDSVAAAWQGAPSSTGLGKTDPGTARARRGGSLGGDPDRDANGWSNFASFDQFPASEMSLSGRGGSFGSPFGSQPPRPPATATAEPVGAAETPLLDLGRNSGETGGGAVGALGDQLAGMSFPVSFRVEQQPQPQRQASWETMSSTVGESNGSLLNTAGAGLPEAWMLAPSGAADQVAPGGSLRSASDRDGFASTFPQLGGAGLVQASGSSQHRQLQQQQPPPSLSPPMVPIQAGVPGGVMISPSPTMGYPQVATSAVVDRGSGSSPLSQQWSTPPDQRQQRRQQWQSPGNGGDVHSDAQRIGSDVPALSSGTMMGGMVGVRAEVGGSPPVVASPSLGGLQRNISSEAWASMSGPWPTGRQSSGGMASTGGGGTLSGSLMHSHQYRHQQPQRQQQQQQQQNQDRQPFGNAARSRPPSLFPGAGGSS